MTVNHPFHSIHSIVLLFSSRNEIYLPDQRISAELVAYTLELIQLNSKGLSPDLRSVVSSAFMLLES